MLNNELLIFYSYTVEPRYNELAYNENPFTMNTIQRYRSLAIVSYVNNDV